ncbi:MAG: Na/Pi cotransporter family protein [Clostridia bacterium]|nr:Na/Pi cotransporter family protein [Clostridia bacterium]
MWLSILTLLTGVGVFLVGMNMMSNGLEKCAGRGMKTLLGKISTNRFAGVGTGIAATAIIQSSSATSVIVIGFVNAGIMTLAQATSIIMGANVGTTVTNALVALSGSDFDIDVYMMALAFVGVVMSFFKKESIKNVGTILSGLGVLFIGLDLMSGALGGAEIKSFFTNLFATISFPLLLILLGVIFTALVQSSSAATGIVIVMAGQGVLGIGEAMFIVLGATIGTCITSTLASLGAGVNAKRTAFIHLLINVVGTCVFTAVIWPLSSTIEGWLLQINDPMWQITIFHIVYKILLTIVLLPFVNQLVAIAEKVFKDAPTESEKLKLKYVDERLLKSPTIALMQVKKEINYMMEKVKENIDICFNNSNENAVTLAENERVIDFTNGALTNFLIKLSASVEEREEVLIGAYFHVLNDLERIGDHAENFYEIDEEMADKGLEFSNLAIEEIKNMRQSVREMFTLAEQAFKNLDVTVLPNLTDLENKVDEEKRQLASSHYNRLAEGKCKVELSPYFTSTISGLERVADHLVNVGYSIVNPTGAQDDE